MGYDEELFAALGPVQVTLRLLDGALPPRKSTAQSWREAMSHRRVCSILAGLTSGSLQLVSCQRGKLQPCSPMNVALLLLVTRLIKLLSLLWSPLEHCFQLV